MRRSHTISAIKTKQPIVLNLLVNGEGIHTRVRERGENSPFEKEIGDLKNTAVSAAQTIFLPTSPSEIPSIESNRSDAKPTLHTHMRLYIYVTR